LTIQTLPSLRRTGDHPNLALLLLAPLHCSVHLMEESPSLGYLLRDLTLRLNRLIGEHLSLVCPLPDHG
ncbi:MAG: hypothetical protein OEW20_08510, partial [Nitrospira sp.]|nr:hypothetical protein [Nitrospira sp.]